MVCELSSRFSILWPLNRACAVVVSALVLLFAYLNPHGKRRPSPLRQSASPGLGPSRVHVTSLGNSL